MQIMPSKLTFSLSLDSDFYSWVLRAFELRPLGSWQQDEAEGPWAQAVVELFYLPTPAPGYYLWVVHLQSLDSWNLVPAHSKECHRVSSVTGLCTLMQAPSTRMPSMDSMASWAASRTSNTEMWLYGFKNKSH